MRERPPESWCWQTLRKLRWGKTVCCPHCHEKARRHRRRRYTDNYWCRHCRRIFSDLTGTPFENSKVPLAVWFQAIDIMESGEPVTISGLAKMTGTRWRTGRTMKKKLWHLRKTPLTRSIGMDILLWKRNNRVDKKSEAVRVRDSNPLSDLIETIGSPMNRMSRVRVALKKR